MNRTIFPNLQLFKKEITERLLVAIREIYKHHPVYLYDEMESATKILIYPSYADTEYTGEMPKILVKPGGYQFGLNDTLFNNFETETKNDAGLISGYTYSKMMITSFQAIIHAYAEEESSDIADEFVQLAVFACRTMFDQVGIKIEEAQVSETDLVDKDAGKYQTVVSIAIDYPWGGKITTNGDPVDDIYTDPPDIDDSISDAYRAPGVEVFRRKWKRTSP